MLNLTNLSRFEYHPATIEDEGSSSSHTDGGEFCAFEGGLLN